MADSHIIFGCGAWHPDSPRTFVAALPYPLPEGTELLDEAGAPLGAITKTWRTIEGKTACRVRLSVAAHRAHPKLRDDLIAHRKNLCIDAAGRLVLAPAVDLASLAAAPTQRHSLWLTAPRVVASQW